MHAETLKKHVLCFVNPCQKLVGYAGYCEHTSAHDLFLGDGFLVQNAELIMGAQSI